MRIEKDGMYFRYYTDKFIPVSINRDDNRCCICGYGLDVEFQFIISKLRRAGFLSDNFHALCCYCMGVKTQAVKEGYALGTYNINLKEKRERWIKYFPLLNISCSTKRSFFRGGGVFLAHQRGNICRICSREGCHANIQNRAMINGDCAGFAPGLGAQRVMERIEEFNNAMDERDDGIEIMLDIVPSIGEWMNSIEENNGISIIDYNTHYPDLHQENNEENDDKD